MKKIILFITCICLLSGCSSPNEKIDVNRDVDNENINSEEQITSELEDPVVEWCQLYNPNGFNTITCIISNPNDVDIDISYDLVFYKENKEVYRTEEQWSNYQISKNHNDVIWGNVNIPSSDDADEVRMENITVTKSYYDSIESDIKYIETINDKAYFSVKHDKVPTLNTIWIFLYNDDNNNKKCDNGELVVVNTRSVMEKETKISIDTDVYDYNAYEIYYNAY